MEQQKLDAFNLEVSAYPLVGEYSDLHAQPPLELEVPSDGESVIVPCSSSSEALTTPRVTFRVVPLETHVVVVVVVEPRES